MSSKPSTFAASSTTLVFPGITFNFFTLCPRLSRETPSSLPLPPHPGAASHLRGTFCGSAELLAGPAVQQALAAPPHPPLLASTASTGEDRQMGQSRPSLGNVLWVPFSPAALSCLDWKQGEKQADPQTWAAGDSALGCYTKARKLYVAHGTRELGIQSTTAQV